RWDVTELLMHSFIFEVPRLVSQRSNHNADNSSVSTSNTEKLTADLVVLPRPAHNAWPGHAMRRPPQANIRAYLKTDDEGSGASIILTSVIQQALPKLEDRAKAKLLTAEEQQKVYEGRCQGPIIQYFRGHNDVAEQQLLREALMRQYLTVNPPDSS